MKIFIILILLIPINLSAQLDSINWILGEWVMNYERAYLTESWEKISENSIEGSGITRDNESDSTLFSESLRILDMNGEIFYLAKVRQNRFPIPFKLTYQDSNKIIFENENHDFPQIINYIRLNNDSLKVIIGLLNDEKSNREFRFKKK